MRRFYSPKINEKQISLDAVQTRHLRNVLRLSVGEKVRIFDGEGREFLAEIQKIEKRKTILTIIKEVQPASKESELNLTLGVSLLKGDRFDLVIQKAVELGVTGFVPIISKRCDVKLKNPEKKLERWQKIIIEASKQSGRSRLMTIKTTQSVEKFIEISEGTKILFSEKKGESFSQIKPTKEITALIGPEGGWEDSELDFAGANNFHIITLNGRILRAETAVISIATILQHRFGDLN